MPRFEFEPIGERRLVAYVSGDYFTSDLVIQETGTILIRVLTDTAGALSMDIDQDPASLLSATVNAGVDLITNTHVVLEQAVVKDELINFSFSVAAQLSIAVSQRRG